MVRLAAALLLSFALATGCGSDSDSESDADDTTAATSDEADPPDETDAPAATEAPPPTEAGPVDPGERNCHVDITGEVTASFDSPQTEDSFVYDPSEPFPSFTLRCASGEMDVTISDHDNALIPMEPAEYTLSGEQPLLDGVDGFPLKVGLNIQSATSLASATKIVEDGVVSITTFDEERIEGTFTIPAGSLMADSASTIVTGAFAFDVAATTP